MIKFGVSIREKSIEPVRRIACLGEELGYDTFSPVEGHYIEWPEVAGLQYLRPLNLLSYVAAITKKIRLLYHALLVTYHNPIHLALELGTLDVISNGRLIVAPGAGWSELELSVFGRQFKDRFAAYDETIELIKKFWTEDNVSFQGRIYNYKNITISECAKPVQKPHPPLWLCGGTNRAIERAVRIGDSWYPGNIPFPKLKVQVEYFTSLLRSKGRDYERMEIPLARSCIITRTNDKAESLVKEKFLHWSTDPKMKGFISSIIFYRKLADPSFRVEDLKSDHVKDVAFFGGPEQVIEQMKDYKALGFNHFILYFPSSNTEEYLEQMKIFANEVIPKAR